MKHRIALILYFAMFAVSTAFSPLSAPLTSAARRRAKLILGSTAVPPPSTTSREADDDTGDGGQMTQYFVPSSHVYEKDIPFLIENLAPDNFDVSLELLQPLLMSECVGEVCEDYLTLLQDKAASIDKTLPEDFKNSFT